MPLDRLPPAPAPITPSTQRAPRASDTDAQAFALPDAQNRNPSPSAEQADRNAANARDKAQSDQARTDKAQDDKSRTEKAQREADSQVRDAKAGAEAEANADTAETAQTETTAPVISLNEIQVADPAATQDGEIAADLSAKLQAGAASDGADTNVKPDGDAKSAVSDSANTAKQVQTDTSAQATAGSSAAPASPQQDGAEAPQASAAAKSVSGDQARQSGAATAPNASGAATPSSQNAQPVDGRAAPTGAATGEASAPQDGADVPAQADASASEAETETSDQARAADLAKTESRPEASPVSPSKEQAAATAQSDEKAQPAAAQTQATPAPETTPQNVASKTASASAQDGSATHQAQAQVLHQEASAQTRRAESDRAPGAQNKARQSDGGEPSAAKPDANAAKSAAVASAKPTGVEPAQPAAQSGQTPAPAVTAYTDPLTFLLQDTALSSEVPVEPAADAIDPDLEIGAVRQDARTEAQRPGQAQAHTAARFAPTTTHTLAAQIARKFNDGARVFDIRLDPPELGRVEVRLELGPDNKVSAVLSAERADTLSELQRSARDLEKALTDAGLELGEDGLSFSLSEDGGAFTNFDDDANGSADAFAARNRFTAEVETDLPDAPLADALYGFAVNQRAGVNLIA